jgi:CRISPR-associated protein Cas1
MLRGRLGLETARIPQGDRHGLFWLGRGKLYVEDGTLRFATTGTERMTAGDYAIPFQMLNCILLEPGATVSHDALRLLARHGVGMVAIGEGGVRLYASMPAGPDASKLARAQVRAWADESGERIRVARLMYAWRLGEVLGSTQIEVLRGMEGARAKETYRRLAEQYGIEWHGRRYDRNHPEGDDVPNQSINHAATAVVAAGEVAVAVAGAVPQLGFIHEDSAIAFPLDVADLFRDSVTVPAAFAAAAHMSRGSTDPLERVVRRLVAAEIRRQQVIPSMIDRIKELFGDDDRRSRP